MTEQKINKTRLALVFILATILFLAGILLGNYINSSKISSLLELQEDLKIQTSGLEIQSMIIMEQPCNPENLRELNRELDELGQKIEYLEKGLKIHSEQLRKLKVSYSLLEIRHWLILKKIDNLCRLNLDFILYFYSNNAECQSCEEQGFILDYLRDKNPALKIYSFDANLNNPTIKLLSSQYSITQVPSLVINEKSYAGFRSKDEIETLLHE